MNDMASVIAQTRFGQLAATLAQRILVVEDDRDSAQLLVELLRAQGFAASAVRSAPEMDAVLKREHVDLMLLDIGLPGEDGFSICRRVRAAQSIPIIIVSGRAEGTDRIVGLEIGADDYIVKPFDARELIARIRALLRRVQSFPGARDRCAEAMRFAGWHLDPVMRRLQDPNGQRVAMTSVEIDLLLAFCRNPRRVLSRERLLDLIHGGPAGSTERSIDVHVSRIRQKIERDPRDPALIRTVRLGGYLFTPVVEYVE